MKVQNRSRNRRTGQALVRTVFGLGAVASGTLAYMLSDVSRVEAIVLPAIVLALVVFGITLYSRVRKTQDWSAAWEK